MENRNRTLIILAALALVIGVICLSAAAAGGIAYYMYAEQAPQSLVQWLPRVFDNQPAVVENQPQTPLGDEIDLEALFSPFWESRELLHDNFVDQPINDQVLADGALEGLEQALIAAEIDPDEIEAAPERAPSAEELSTQAGTPDEVRDEFAAFWAAWRDVEYGDLDLDMTYEQLMQNSLHYMVAALGDPHTAYLDPYEYQQTQMDLEGEYEGIGAWVDTSTEYLTIIAPMEGSPAEEAGLLPGDRVIAIDGEDMTGIPGDIVIQSVLGPAGSKVVLTIERDDVDEPFDVEITRRHIVIPTVRTEMEEGNIAYIQLYNFGADSGEQLHNALEDALAQNPSGLILDLRNNGGGYLHAAIDICSEFVDDGVLLYEVYGDDTRDTHNALKGGIALDIPLVVLINQGTASASEILAGVVQDYDRGTLVGDTTFGKGSVQLPVTLADNQGALRITIAKWLTPKERHIQDVGIEPDVYVEVTQEDVEAGIDRQLEKAIEILTSS
jgi:carboxyl-terminal processing protease